MANTSQESLPLARPAFGARHASLGAFTPPKMNRRRCRLLLVLVLALATTAYLFTGTSLFGHGQQQKQPQQQQQQIVKGQGDSLFSTLFDIDAVNKYWNKQHAEDSVGTQGDGSGSADEVIDARAAALLNQYEHAQEKLLNDADLLKKLYLQRDHAGIINYGSTGNMANAELNALKNTVLKKQIDEEIHGIKSDPESKAKKTKTKAKSKELAAEEEEGADEDRTIPLFDASIPDEDAFSKIQTEEFIKGDITFQNFFAHTLKLISHNHLSFPLKRRMKLEKGKPHIDNVLFYEQPDDILSEQELYPFFDFPQNFIDDLKVKHENVVRGIPDIVPQFYKGNGYVTVGGGIYSWYALLGIETLRKVGSKLPVEVFLPEITDYEYEFCDKILPKLNARCIEMYTIFNAECLKDFEIKGYQYKSFALLASSFENAFLLDSDSYPVQNPDILFESELYQEYQMITWPDFWRRTTSPVFYEIRGTEVGMVPVRHLNDFFVPQEFMSYKQGDDVTKDIPYHDRGGTIPDWTTESGEMLINKRIHFRTLILALYYNHDGPYGYYPLLSQGGAGEGDKETFVAAANFYGLKYYQVNKKPERFFGWYNEEDRWEHSTIVQYNPLTDFKLLQKTREQMRKDIEEQKENYKYDYNKYFPDVFTSAVMDPMFYHVHDPKMDPFNIMDKRYTLNLQGKRIRNMGEDFPRNKFDVELFVWGTINHYICEMKLEFAAFDGANWGLLCKDFMPSQMEYLRKSSKSIYSAFDSNNVVEQLQGGRDWN
jgi:alpha 1,2-mannosyltransferase